MLKVGITGGIGTGKTTVCDIFDVIGIPIYNADIRAKKLMVISVDVKSKIRNLLGKDAYFKNGRLNRKFISSKVFNNEDLLKSLNSIVHPAVGIDFDHWVNHFMDKPYVIKEAALLIESKSYITLDKLLLVTANEEVRVGRVMRRDNVSEKSVRDRIMNQMPEKSKMEFADFIIDNSGSKSLIQQVFSLHHKLLKIAQEKG